jgi:uncharacterized protein
MSSSDAPSANRLTALIKGNQLAVFVILAYALSWWPWVWYQYDPVAADAPILPLGPFLAAFIVLALSGGWKAVKEWFAKIFHWRVGWVWYAVAVLLPLGLTLSAMGINLMMGAQRAAAFQVPDTGSLAVRFVFIFLFIGLGEEPAWRGFALPRLLQGRTALTAALILGLIHMVWHGPLYGVEYDSANVVPWGITVFCVSIVICWMWLHTGGSLLLPMLLHASNNTVALVWRMFEGGDQLRLWWIWCALWVTATAAIVFTTGKDLTRSMNAA